MSELEYKFIDHQGSILQSVQSERTIYNTVGLSGGREIHIVINTDVKTFLGQIDSLADGIEHAVQGDSQFKEIFTENSVRPQITSEQDGQF